MTITETIISLEWEQFQAVNNEGGRAGCQDDYETFEIMRESQFSVWPGDLLSSYLGDLKEAKAAGRNLIAEKYLWMMESTCPEAFRAQSAFLPDKSYSRERMEENIIRRQVAWMEAYARQYPCLAAGGRPIHTSEDTEYETSFETYLRGEISTYSPQTLGMYAQWVETLAKDGTNMSIQVMKHTVARYGYKSIEEAEAREKEKAENVK